MQFRKILDHPGVDPVSALFPLAYLGLARADSQADCIHQSKTENLFALCGNANPDLPVLQAARKEYASRGALIALIP